MGERSELALRFGRTIRRLRLDAKHSQEAFAAEVGIHRTYQGAVERGEKTVTIDTADKLARALGLSLVGLFSELEHEP